MLGIFCVSSKPNLDFDPCRAGPTGQGGITDFARFRTDGAFNKDPIKSRCMPPRQFFRRSNYLHNWAYNPNSGLRN